MQTKWRLDKLEFLGLALYSCAFPLGIYFEGQHHVPHAFLLGLINLPFLVILGPLLMLATPFQHSQLTSNLLAWAIVFAQSYFAFVYLRRRAERTGVSTLKALVSSVGRAVLCAIAAIVAGGLVLAFILRTS